MRSEELKIFGRAQWGGYLATLVVGVLLSASQVGAAGKPEGVRYHDYKSMTAFLRELADGHPKLMKLEGRGRLSEAGRYGRRSFPPVIRMSGLLFWLSAGLTARIWPAVRSACNSFAA